MSNRETYPASQSPLQGDVSGAAGATTVTVTGIQGTPISPIPPDDQQVLVYQALTNRWEPRSVFGLEIEGHGTSLDKQVYINGVPDGSLLWAIEIEGTPDGG